MLRRCLRKMTLPVWVACCKTSDRTVQSCGDNVGRDSAVHYAPDPNAGNVGDAMHRYLADHETTSISGAFLCCRRSTFETLDGFSEAFPNSFQDVDFCLRAPCPGYALYHRARHPAFAL